MTSLYSLILILVLSSVYCSDEDDWPPDLLPKTCAEAVKPWESTDGVFKLELRSSESGPFDVFCIHDPEGGPAWTIIQRRIDGSVNFYRNWTDYELGFGNASGEYFLGLEKIHELTNSDKNELWVELVTPSNEARYAKYGTFSIEDAEHQYTLNVGKFYRTSTAGDSMEYHNGMKFSTLDNDNDMLDPAKKCTYPDDDDDDKSKNSTLKYSSKSTVDGNKSKNSNLKFSSNSTVDGNSTIANGTNVGCEYSCAEAYETAWWLRDCLRSDLNGIYIYSDREAAQTVPGIAWPNWDQDGPVRYNFSIKYVHMAIRPLRYSSIQ